MWDGGSIILLVGLNLKLWDWPKSNQISWTWYSNYIYLFHVVTSSSGARELSLLVWGAGAWELSLFVWGEEKPSVTLLTVNFLSQREHLSPLRWSHASLQSRWSREVFEHLHSIFNITNSSVTNSSFTNALHCMQFASCLWTVLGSPSPGRRKSGTVEAVAPPANFHKKPDYFHNLICLYVDSN